MSSFDQSSFVVGTSPLALGVATAAAALQPFVDIVTQTLEHVTRPYVGDFAILTVRTESGKILFATDHFLLAMVNESDQERTSIRFSLGDPTMYAGAGRMPKLYSYTGFLIDTVTGGPMISAWRVSYDRYLRGSVCVKKHAILELQFRDRFYQGYMTSCVTSYDATRPQVASLTFTMFITTEKAIR